MGERLAKDIDGIGGPLESLLTGLTSSVANREAYLGLEWYGELYQFMASGKVEDPLDRYAL